MAVHVHDMDTFALKRTMNGPGCSAIATTSAGTLLAVTMGALEERRVEDYSLLRRIDVPGVSGVGGVACDDATVAVSLHSGIAVLAWPSLAVVKLIDTLRGPHVFEVLRSLTLLEPRPGRPQRLIMAQMWKTCSMAISDLADGFYLTFYDGDKGVVVDAPPRVGLSSLCWEVALCVDNGRAVAGVPCHWTVPACAAVVKDSHLVFLLLQHEVVTLSLEA